jgi:hypothetical protein
MNSALQQQTHQELIESKQLHIKEKGMDHAHELSLKEVEMKGKISESERIAKVEAEMQIKFEEIKVKGELEKLRLANLLELEKFKILRNQND